MLALESPMTADDETEIDAATDGDRVAIVAGLRTPFACSAGALAALRGVELGVEVVKELVQRVEIDPRQITLCVHGQVLPTLGGLSIARELVLGAALPSTTEAFSVSRACTTFIVAMTSAIEQIRARRHDVAIACGADSLSNVPREIAPALGEALSKAQQARSFKARMKALEWLPAAELLPRAPELLREPTTGELLGETAEKMAKAAGLSREQQDATAQASHAKASRAWASEICAQEAMTVIPPPYQQPVCRDEAVWEDASLEALARLTPAFDRHHGTITTGNSAALADGASALLLMRESKARSLGCVPLGFVRSWAYSAVDPGGPMLMASVFAVAKALERARLELADMDLVEVHEAFAAQLLCHLQAMASKRFATEQLGRTEPLGEVDPDRLNIHGGAIAMGHPPAATGGRMILSSLGALRRRGGHHALLSLCGAGGLGAAVVLEAAS